MLKGCFYGATKFAFFDARDVLMTRVLTDSMGVSMSDLVVTILYITLNIMEFMFQTL